MAEQRARGGTILGRVSEAQDVGPPQLGWRIPAVTAGQGPSPVELLMSLCVEDGLCCGRPGVPRPVTNDKDLIQPLRST